MALKPTPAERATARAGTPLNQEALKIQVQLTQLCTTMNRVLRTVDGQIAVCGGLANVQADLGGDAADFDSAYDQILAAVVAIDPAATPPVRTRDRTTEIAANKRAGIP